MEPVTWQYDLLISAVLGFANMWAIVWLSGRSRPRRSAPPPPSPAQSMRRIRMQRNGGRHTPQEWRDLCAQYGHVCLACGYKRPLTKDHVIPVYLGGSDAIENIQPLCKSCNSRKHARHIDYRKK